MYMRDSGHVIQMSIFLFCPITHPVHPHFKQVFIGLQMVCTHLISSVLLEWLRIRKFVVDCLLRIVGKWLGLSSWLLFSHIFRMAYTVCNGRFQLQLQWCAPVIFHSPTYYLGLSVICFMWWMNRQFCYTFFTWHGHTWGIVGYNFHSAEYIFSSMLAI